MNEDRIFRYIDLIRWVLYGLVAGAVALASWATKMQFQMSDLRSDNEVRESKTDHYRDLAKNHDIQEEHRFSILETDVSWLKNRRSQ